MKLKKYRLLLVALNIVGVCLVLWKFNEKYTESGSTYVQHSKGVHRRENFIQNENILKKENFSDFYGKANGKKKIFEVFCYWFYILRSNIFS